MNRRLIVLGIVLLLAAGLAACGSTPPPTTQATDQDSPEQVACPTAPACPSPSTGTVDTVPFEQQWAGSPHNDAEAEAFVHWDEEDPAEVPTSCARCHSTPGYLDFLGADGTAAGAVDNAAPVGTTITCEACHSETAAALTSVTFPSEAEVTGLGPSARCMVCHQGRASGVTVDANIEELGLTEDIDTPNAELGFVNIHYFAAAASLFGSEAHGGYEYTDKAYQVRFAHVDGYTECIDCHDQHTLEIRVEECATCHEGVSSVEDLRDTRMNGSLADYDGDGDVAEGMSFELDGLREKLLQAIMAYADEVAGTPIAYNEASYPYFFIDDGDGVVSEAEAVRDNGYNAWTARLLRAAYNYQVTTKDPGAFAHNAKYHAALLYDSIESLNEALSEPVDISTAARNDSGHFDGTGEPFRHWDEDGEVPGSCSRCHSAEGLALYLEEGAAIGQAPANAFMCDTCHQSLGGDWPLRVAEDATFPSGATLTFGEGAESNLCLQCHQGRSSSPSLDRALGDKPADTVDESIRFVNVHYFAAGATLFGNDAMGAYQYPGKTYVGRFEHVDGFNQCGDCHDVHALEVEVEACSGCHDSEEPTEYRMDSTDWDGDGDAEEGIYGEAETIREALYAAIQAYATETAGTGILYNASAYPYFFNDTNGNGVADPDEVNGDNSFASWTPRLLRAAYNYQYSLKDPGAFAHNGKYLIQFLYDSLEDLGGAEAVAGMTRP